MSNFFHSLCHSCGHWRHVQPNHIHTKNPKQWGIQPFKAQRLMYVGCVWNVIAHAQKPDFVFRAKRTSPFKSVRGGRGRQYSRLVAVEVCGIRRSNAGYTVFRGSVKSTGYPLHSPVSHFTSPTVRHRVPSYFNWTLPLVLSLKFPTFCPQSNCLFYTYRISDKILKIFL